MLAIDAGTSSVRASLYDPQGRALEGTDCHVPYRADVRADGTAQLDARRLLRLVSQAIDGALRARPEADVLAVGLSTFWHGLLGLDRRGAPATPILLWSDSRSWRQAEWLRAEFDAESAHQRTGCPIHPSYWPAKLAWAGVGSAAQWCSPGDFLFLQLFGRLQTSLSVASATGMWSLRGDTWDAEWLDRLGLNSSRLPPIGERESGLRSAFARRWPRLRDVPWALARGDGALASLGSGCASPERRALTIGTSGALRVMTDRVPERLPPGLWCYRLDASRVVVGGSFSTGGNLHAWCLENLRVVPGALERRLARMAPCAHGLVFLPLLAGERSPGFAAHATGALAGLSLATTATDIVRAGLEGVAMEFAKVDRQLDELFPGPATLVASGAGLISSPAWQRILCDCVGRRLVVSGSGEASSRGAALVALELAGVAVRPPRTSAGRTFRPRRAASRVYREAERRQEDLYRSLVIEGVATASAPAHLQPPGPMASNGG